MVAVSNALQLMLVAYYCASPCISMRANYTRQPLLGYRCMMNNPSYQITLNNTARTRCVWRCLSSNDCVVISFNHRLNNCELSMQLCDTVASAADFSINVYSIERKLCSLWVPKSEFDAQRAVKFRQNAGRADIIAVARKWENSGLFPGKHQRFNSFRIQIAVDENTFVTDGRGEILLVDSACLWKWIPYASPNILPIEALVAGYDVNREPLYVTRAKFQGVYSIGYYKSSTSLGYFMIVGGVSTSTVMHVLVIL